MRAGGLTGRGTGMQVIASKDAEIEDLKKRLKDAIDIIKSRDDTISARDAQIAGLQNELDDLRKQLAEAKLKAAELEADLKKTQVCVRRMRVWSAIVCDSESVYNRQGRDQRTADLLVHLFTHIRQT
jgi:chromosome segregation ATPase